METGIQEIKTTDKLLRRCRFADPSYVRDDLTVTSFAFKLRKSETDLSVDIERLTTYKQSIKDILQYRLFSILASQIREAGADCIHKPEPDNYAHAEITGNITNSVSSKLAKAAVYVNYPSTK